MASWMALASSRAISAGVLLLRHGSGVGHTKTSMCFGVATAHAGYLHGSQRAIAGYVRQAHAAHGSRAEPRQPSRGTAAEAQGQTTCPTNSVRPRVRRARVG